MNTNTKFRAGAAFTAALVALSLSACTANTTQSGSESGALASPTATAAPTHSSSATDTVGAQINSINEKSGFYDESGRVLNDPASGDYKQIKLPDGWTTKNVVYYASGKEADENAAFDGLDKEKILAVASKAIIGSLDGERSYALTVETNDDTRNSDLTTQMASIQDGYVPGKFDQVVSKYISDTDATRSSLETAISSGSDDAITKIFTDTSESTSLENEFAGPYIPLKGGYSVKALGQSYNRIAIDSVDYTSMSRIKLNMNTDAFQPYLGISKGDSMEAVNVRIDYTYRIPLLDPATDTVKLSNTLHASTYAIVAKGTNGTYSVWITGSSVSREASRNVGNLDMKVRGAENATTVIKPIG